MAYKYRDKKGTKIDYRIVLVLLAVIVIAAIALNARQPEETSPPIEPYCGDGVCQTTESCSSCQTDCGECPVPITFKGELVIAAKDVINKLTGGYSVTGLNLTVKSIQVHQSGTNDTDENITAAGWITVFNGTKTFDLVEYSEDVIALLGEKELDPGKYTQIRLYISEVDVKLYNFDMAIWNKTYDAKVPSKVLKLIHPFTIEENKTLVLTLDFDVFKSFCKGILCRRSGGPSDWWVFKPVLKTDVGPLHDGILEEILERGKRPENSVEIPEE